MNSLAHKMEEQFDEICEIKPSPKKLNFIAIFYYKKEEGSLHIFPVIDGFKGNLDGNFHTIFGFYNGSEYASLFNNLSGTIENMYIDNTLIYGKYMSAGVVLNADNATIRNIVFDGNVLSNVKSNTTTAAWE